MGGKGVSEDIVDVAERGKRGPEQRAKDRQKGGQA
jgi:hypothetical protein